MAHGIVCLVLSLVTLHVSYARNPNEPERCAGFDYVDLTKLPRFDPRVVAGRMHSTMIIYRLPVPNHPDTKFILEYRMVNGTFEFVTNEVGRSILPAPQGCSYRQFQAVARRGPYNPCYSSRLAFPPGSEHKKEIVLYSPDRNTVILTFCLEKVNKICTMGLLSVITRQVQLSPRRRNSIVYKLERHGFLKEFGATRADLRMEDTRHNDCEFPPDVLERLECNERSKRRRKIYRY